MLLEFWLEARFGRYGRSSETERESPEKTAFFISLFSSKPPPQMSKWGNSKS